LARRSNSGRCEGPCSVAIDLFTGMIEGETEHLFVNDLSKDKRFSAMGCVSGSPFKRFYVTVPLRSCEGIVVGAFRVMDEYPRNVASDAEMAYDTISVTHSQVEYGALPRKHIRAAPVLLLNDFLYINP